MECVKTHLKSVIEPTCFSCSKVWLEPFLRKNLPISFCNTELLERQVDMVMEQQRNQLPSTMHLVNEITDIKTINELIKGLNVTYKTLREKLGELSPLVSRSTCEEDGTSTKQFLNHSNNYSSCLAEFNRIRDDLYHLKTTRTELQTRRNVLRIGKNIWPTEPPIQKETRSIPCSTVDCRGFININEATHVRCDLCNEETCITCTEHYVDEHVCNPNTIANIITMETDSKQCPGCKAYIHRLIGCYQMWCTQCHTTFDWNSGKELTERIHNPHYKEYVKTHGLKWNPAGRPGCVVQPADARQEFVRRGLIVWNDVWHLTNKLTKPQYLQLREMFRIPTEIEAWLRVVNTFLEQVDQNWTTMRVEYLRKNLTDDKWRKDVRYNLKRRKRLVEDIQLGETLLMLLVALQNEYMNGKDEITTLCSYVDLQTYIIECFRELDKYRKTKSDIIRILPLSVNM